MSELPRTDSRVIFRPYDQERDGAFVATTWVKSYGERSGWAAALGQVYWREHRKCIDRLLARSVVRIAGWLEDPNVILGWAVGETEAKGTNAWLPQDMQGLDTLHYVLVRGGWQRSGIATGLLKCMGLARLGQYTHQTREWRHFMKGPGRELLAGWYYDPYPALR